jgi:ribosomal protein L35
MKSNKSFLKRIKVTKSGKLVARRPGHDHFNAKESRKTQLAKNRTQEFSMTNKEKSLFLAHSGLKKS